ncbi:LOW QUALITY PROTEIN: hypothetical protein Cgig2_028322 [Carnegiea gigantea]|uniref:Uncharacterized protein n=1 Tax=Carnegiea gigantea TaxID=171969 RepID=A0A9Q1QJG8_9CARY|nr:LOW QUALITY PROTEIN: hypothetical protein Cgig2_028322 [Carnegiea gigantea]
MFGRDRQQGTSTTDVQSACNHNALMNSTKNQSTTEMVVLSRGPSDGTGLIIKRYPVKSLEVSKATTELFIQVGGRPETMRKAFGGMYLGCDQYQWAPEMHLWLKKNFTEKTRLKDLVCNVTKKKREDPTPWLSPDVQEQLLQHKKSSRGFLKRSRQSMLNKTIGPKARSRHILGSVSAAEITKRLRKAGETPTATKLFAKAHVRAKDKSFSDDQSKAVWLIIEASGIVLSGQRRWQQPPLAPEHYSFDLFFLHCLYDHLCTGFVDKYQSLKVAKQVPTSYEDDGLFLEAAGGWTEKGTVFGLGNAAEYFYKRPTAGTCSIKPSYTPSIVSQLQNELDSTKAELNSMKMNYNSSISLWRTNNE